ncbi:MAG: hypothetical protein ACFCVE_07090 [Phycisphaerae bacterium]
MQLLWFIQVPYWLALSTWFGGVLFLALAAPVVFRTVRAADPTLPRVLSVNLEGQHATLLAGGIVNDILQLVGRIQLYAAAVLVLCVLAQWLVLPRSSDVLLLQGIRSTLLLAAVGLAVYGYRVVMPKVQEKRDTYIRHADEPDVANPASDAFDRYHAESVFVLRSTLFLLVGLILFSAGITADTMTTISF